MKDFSRRMLFKIMALIAVGVTPLRRIVHSRTMDSRDPGQHPLFDTPLGVEQDGFSHVYYTKNGTPEENLAKTIEMTGGIGEIVDRRDIVIIKPNAQWWNQGMTNTDVMKAFIDLVLNIEGFAGEIIIADNHQFAEDNSRGWTTNEKNGKFNYNELIEHYHRNGHANVTKSHWHVAGKTKLPLEGDAQGRNRVNGPQDGNGYVWLDDTYYLSPDGRKCMMTYPVFTSEFSGITIDLKNGAWRGGGYLKDRNVRFINFSALNHHGYYCGVTASVKNLMGVVDMSCGFPGNLPEGTFNTHHIGVSKIISWKKNKLFARILGRLGLGKLFVEYCYQNFHHTGGSLGRFMRSVRMPDMNIITAERVGWGSRIDLQRSFMARTVLISKDPVALDYIAAKDVLLPGTPPGARHSTGVYYRELNNPDNSQGPFYRFLKETEKEGIGNLDHKNIKIHTVDLDHA